MSAGLPLSWPRRLVLGAAGALLLCWLVLHARGLLAEQNGWLRFTLTALFAALILLRAKPAPAPEAPPARPVPGWCAVLAGLTGALLAVAGIMLRVGLFEWLGLLLLVLACLAWALPPDRLRDSGLALFLLYWAHPLPGQLFSFLQLALQRISVRGAEWLLHLVNVRVWADGLVLRTGVNIYDVPAECSGLRAATTVFLLALGLGVLKRFRWFECLALTLLALVQAAFLNALRIALMVYKIVPTGDGGDGRFLHDTAGIVAVAGVVLLYVEIELWRYLKLRKREAARELNVAGMQAVSQVPPFWTKLYRHRHAWLALLLLLLTATVVAYRSRPRHRAEMIRGVALELEQFGQLEPAERAAHEVERLLPKDDEWRMLITRILILRKKYDEVLRTLDTIPDISDARVAEKNILRAYALMSTGRMEEAAAIVRRLPAEHIGADPRVAMILAQMGFVAGNPDEVAKYVVRASLWNPNLSKIRALYPYLRQYRKWESIVNSDLNVPYQDPVEALSAAEAYMNLNLAPAAGRMALDAMRAWPTDPRVLEPLFFMAIKRGQGSWVERFAEHLVRCVKAMEDADALYGVLDRCLQLSRPDLAWCVVRRMQELDPRHPGIPLAGSVFGFDWFSFRALAIGLPSARASERFDTRPFFLIGGMLPGWTNLCAQVPLGAALAVPQTVAARKQLLADALVAFRERAAAGRLSLDMQYEYVGALEMSGDLPGVLAALESMVASHPEQRGRARLVRSAVYERQGNWQSVYETLRGYESTSDPDLIPLIRLTRAALELRLGLYALQTARATWRRFPEASQAVGMLAQVCLLHDSAEDAHRVLMLPRVRNERELDVLIAKALHLTERYSEGEEQARAALLPRVAVLPGTMQNIFLPPAELACLWHRVSLPAEKDFEENANTLRQNMATATSPFLCALLKVWLRAYETKCEGDSTEVVRWLACGRDATEKALALNQLTLLLCRAGRFAAARRTAELAAAHAPGIPILWRILVSLSGVDPVIVAQARAACPEDSELWLVGLVSRTQRGRAEDAALDAWVTAELQRAIAARVYTPAAFTRSAAYLLRGPHQEGARLAAREACRQAGGLLPAYVAGVRCALRNLDREWALQAMERAIGASLNTPPAFYEKLVELKSDPQVATDANMVEALRSLRREDPRNPRWAQMLGYVRFQRGGWEIVDALYQMNAALEQGATNRSVYVIGAEAARLSGNYPRAVELLERGLELYPDNTVLLNNLVFTLAQAPAGKEQAASLLPGLAARAQGQADVLDTVAVAQMRLGQTESARRTLAEIQRIAPKGSPPWFRVALHLAELALQEERAAEAAQIIRDGLAASQGVSDDDLLAANRVLTQAEERQARQQRLRDDIERGRYIPPR